MMMQQEILAGAALEARVQGLNLVQDRRYLVALVLEIGGPFDCGKIAVRDRLAAHFELRPRIGISDRELRALLIEVPVGLALLPGGQEML